MRLVWKTVRDGSNFGIVVKMMWSIIFGIGALVLGISGLFPNPLNNWIEEKVSKPLESQKTKWEKSLEGYMEKQGATPTFWRYYSSVGLILFGIGLLFFAYILSQT